jgi:hypothetical protein
MRRALYDVLMPAGAVGLLIVFLIAFDGRVREGVMTRVGRGQSSAAVADIGARLTDASSVVFSLIRYETTMHSTLVIFVLAATVLTVLMLRV